MASSSSTSSLSNTAGAGSKRKRNSDAADSFIELQELSIINQETETGSKKMKKYDLLCSTTGSFGDNWNCRLVLFPYPPDGDRFKTSNEIQSLTVPPPPPYKPHPPDSPTYIAEANNCSFGGPRDGKLGLHGGYIEQSRGADGKYFRKEYYDFAREALKWYNCKEGRKFQMMDLFKVETHIAFGIYCIFTMNAAEVDDANVPIDDPLTFEAKYLWGRFSEENKVLSCRPL